MNNKKILGIVAVVIILGFIGILAYSITNDDRNVYIVNNESNITKNNSNSTLDNFTKNSSSINKKEGNDNFKPNHQQNIKKPSKPKLISKEKAIKKVKADLKREGVEYTSISATLVKKNGKYYWSVSFTESDGRPSITYVSAESK